MYRGALLLPMAFILPWLLPAPVFVFSCILAAALVIVTLISYGDMFFTWFANKNSGKAAQTNA